MIGINRLYTYNALLMKRLSVIIPIYKVEQYIEKCLRSIGNQDIPSEEYEIICINDGSPDNSLDILLTLQKEYSNIRIINQENQGVSRARNNGMDIAAGRYILFIDPDDSVEPDSFQRILEKAETNEAQVSFLGFTVYGHDGLVEKKIYNANHASVLYDGLSAYPLSRGTGKTDPDRIWAVLIERELLNKYDLRFLPAVPFLEDGELITRIMCHTERCIFDGRPFYIRTTRQGSATNSDLYHSPRATAGFLASAVSLKQFQNSELLNERQRVFLNNPIAKFVILTIDSARKPFETDRIKEVSDKLRKAGLGRLHLKGVYMEFTLFGWFYNLGIFPLLLYLFMTRGFRSLNIRVQGWLR